MLDNVTRTTFTEHLGSAFRIHLEGGGSLQVELLEATALSAGGDSSDSDVRCEPFSIVFRGPTEPVLAQCIHRIEHERMGRMDLFLVPIGPDDAGMRYEAVFN